MTTNALTVRVVTSPVFRGKMGVSRAQVGMAAYWRKGCAPDRMTDREEDKLKLTFRFQFFNLVQLKQDQDRMEADEELKIQL